MTPTEVLAANVKVQSGRLIVQLTDGRNVSVPLEWYPRLVHATAAERQNCQIFGEGSAIEWPDVDEHISVEGLLAGRRSGESPASFERRLATRKR